MSGCQFIQNGGVGVFGGEKTPPFGGGQMGVFFHPHILWEWKTPHLGVSGNKIRKYSVQITGFGISMYFMEPK